MENKELIDLSVKYNLNSSELSKLVNLMYQIDIHDSSSPLFGRIADYVCEMKLLDMPAELLVEELKRKGLISD